ncbi:hypothetical protein SDC9_60022 [bioreactor metagenome]|uniref:Uncharacterized protein n=1 Tax=bioreactor metagenome TaxID=1076179 RepID=A0A644XHK9_9ZZZZ
MAAAKTCAAVPSDGIDLVDKDDTGSGLLSLVKEVAHTGGTDADEHFDKVGAGDGIEGYAGLSRDGTGQKRFAGSGRAVEQDALRNAGTDFKVLSRLLQKVDNFKELKLLLFGAGHIVKGDLTLFIGGDLGAGLAEIHDFAAAGTALLVHEIVPEHPKADKEQQIGQHGHPEWRFIGGRKVIALEPSRGSQLIKPLDRNAVQEEVEARQFISHVGLRRVLKNYVNDVSLIDREALDLFFVEKAHDVGVCDDNRIGFVVERGHGKVEHGEQDEIKHYAAQGARADRFLILIQSISSCLYDWSSSVSHWYTLRSSTPMKGRLRYFSL